jgi:hypothetical protein
MSHATALLDLHTRLAASGRTPRPLDAAALAALDHALGTSLPEELRHALSVWGEALRELEPTPKALAASTRAGEPFPHSLADARDAMRPGEYVFLETFDPAGTWLLADLDGVAVHLVVTGEARGTVWLATAHGLAPAYTLVDDTPVQHGFASWYLERLGPADAADADAHDVEAPPRAEANAADAVDAAPPLPPGDVDALLALCIAPAPSDAPTALPAGRYELASTIVVDRDLALDGAGQVQIVAPAGAPAFEVRAARFALRDIEIEGSIPGQVAPGEVGVLVGGDSAGVHLERVVLRALADGLVVGADAAVLVRGCTFTLCARGVEVRERGRLGVHASRFEGAEACVHAEGAAWVHLSRCLLGSATDGVSVMSCEGVRIEGCRFDPMGTTAVELRHSRSCVEGNAISIAGIGVLVDGGVARVAGNAITAATSEGVCVVGDAVARIERNLLGGANYGVYADVAHGGVLTIARNVLRGENLDGILVVNGLARVVENHVTGGRQFGVNADAPWVTVIRNESYRMGREAFVLPDESLRLGNVAYDCDWEDGRKPEGARFGTAPRDEPGDGSRVCAVTGVECVGPARVLVVDHAAPTTPIALPILVTVSGGVVVRSEARPEHDALRAWLGVEKEALPSVVERLLDGGVGVGDRTLGAVLVDDGAYLALATGSPIAATSLDELLDAAFADPDAVRAMLGAPLLDDEALRARLATLAGFVRAGGLGRGTSARGLLVGAVMDGRTEASWFDDSCGPDGAEGDGAFPDFAAVDGLRAATVHTDDLDTNASDDEVWVPFPGLPGVSIAPRRGVDSGTWLGEAAAAFPRTGRWPLLLGGLGDVAQLDPAPTHGRASAEAFLSSRWAEAWQRLSTDHEGRPHAKQAAAAKRTLAPFAGGFPGVAAAVDERAAIALDAAIEHALARMDVLDQDDHALRVLVPCRAPSEVLSALGWAGTTNHYREPDGLAALLESWCDRFGAVPIAVTLDTIDFAVTRPPTERDHATQLAAEHFAACPDLVEQGAGTLGALAKGLRARHAWWMWWD